MTTSPLLLAGNTLVIFWFEAVIDVNDGLRPEIYASDELFGNPVEDVYIKLYTWLRDVASYGNTPLLMLLILLLLISSVPVAFVKLYNGVEIRLYFKLFYAVVE